MFSEGPGMLRLEGRVRRWFLRFIFRSSPQLKVQLLLQLVALAVLDRRSSDHFVMLVLFFP